MTQILPLLLALSASADPATVAAVPGPLTAAAPTADLGVVKSGPPIAHTFALKNGGSGNVRILGVDIACGCIKADVAPKELKPGEAAKLGVSVNTLAMAEGAVKWRAVVRYAGADAAGREAEFTETVWLTGTLVREVSVNPPYLVVSTTGAVETTVRVTDRRDKPLTITKAVASFAGVTAEVQAATTDGVHTQAVSVKVPESLAVGSHEGTLTLTTDDPAYPELVVPLTVHKRAADGPAATPGVATVRFAAGQATASTLVQVRAGGKPVSVKTATSTTDGVTAKHSEGTSEVATVRVAVAADKAGASGKAELTVTLAEPPGTVVVIPVVWYGP